MMVLSFFEISDNLKNGELVQINLKVTIIYTLSAKR